MSKIYTYTGNLETYHEQGMGSNAIIFHDDRGCYTSPGFNNKTKDWDGPPEPRKSLEWAVWLGTKKDMTYEIKILDKNDKVVYEGPLTFTPSSNYISLIPKEIPSEEWQKYVMKEYRGILKTNDYIDGLKKQKIKEFNKELKGLIDG